MTTKAAAPLQPELVLHALAEVQRETGEPAVACKVCGGDALLYDVVDFGKTCTPPTRRVASGVPVYYRRCTRCSFISTAFCDAFTPAQWTAFIYDRAYYETVDHEYDSVRPRGNAAVVDALLCSDKTRWLGLDYGGGNGATAARLRGMDYRYECHDPFGNSDISDAHRGHYDFCSVFEVAEHTPDPRGFLLEIMALCSPARLAVLIGTHVHDAAVKDRTRLSWWYAAPRNGHISLHSRRSLQLLAEQFGLRCHSLSEQTHLLTRGWSSGEAWRFLVTGKLRGRLRRMLGTGHSQPS